MIIAGQPLPSELSLSQLLVLLHERGLPPGYGILEFDIKLINKTSVSARQDKKLKTVDGLLFYCLKSCLL